MNENPDILLVEDNPGDADLIRLRLMEGRPDVNIATVNRLSDALKNLGQHMPALVLLDLNLPDSRGAETFRRVLGKAPGVPVVILSGEDNAELAINAVHQGVQDFLVKGQFDSKQLASAMSYAVERQGMLTALDMNRKQQLQFKDQFLSHVSHELRTPLTSIYQFVTILLDGLAGSLSGEQRDHLETILRGVNQLRAMIADLLEASRAESGKIRIERRCVAIDEVVHQAVAMLQATANEKGIILKVQVDERVPFVFADSDRIIQVLINLIQNAIKFTPRNGFATVDVWMVEPDPDFVYISVTDTGIGIGPEARSQVFERLYQEPNVTADSRKGLGLGLYIARELVRRQGGRMWLESQKGEGSVFSFTLPVFSMAKMLTPIIVAKGRLRESLSLITVEVTARLGIAHRSWRDIREASVEMLGFCILPAKDLLMPALATTRSAERFIIVASTDLAGAQVMMDRINSQLDRRPQIQNAASFTLSASAIPLPVAPDQDLAKVVRQVADTITDMVTNNLRRKVIFDSLDVPNDMRGRNEKSNGQAEDSDCG